MAGINLFEIFKSKNILQGSNTPVLNYYKMSMLSITSYLIVPILRAQKPEHAKKRGQDRSALTFHCDRYYIIEIYF